MMFQKGSKVEVMNKTELPTSWCVAQVISGNKNTYNLKYDCYPGVETVSREYIRPSPPRAKDLKNWAVGDIVEVFDNNSWKTSTVCNVCDENYFSLRLHGFAHEINVHKSNVRARQSWQHGRWVPIVKISGSYGDVNNKQIVEPNYSSKLGLQIPMPDEKTSDENDNNDLLLYVDGRFQESRVVSSSKSLKRASPFCSSLLEASPNNLKASKKGKIDLFSRMEDKTIQANFYNNNNNSFEESDNDDCSVGSCSIYSNDAESFNTLRDEEGNYSCTPEEGGGPESIHGLELHAYRSTLEALYASGPLSWEKEGLLTNLRINLHISNDEHLTELRNLISGGILE